jgi:putative transposase
MKEYGRPRKIVTDGLRAYSAAMKVVGNVDRLEVGRGLNNRAENSHQPFRRRERPMHGSKYEDAAEVQRDSRPGPQPFNQERHLVTQQVYKQRRTAAFAEWRALAG